MVFPFCIFGFAAHSEEGETGVVKTFKTKRSRVHENRATKPLFSVFVSFLVC